MDLSITTDYHVDPDIPRENQCRRMRAAGFEWIHWCYDWNVDVVYGPDGLATAREQIEAAGLRLLDTHGVCWSGGREYHADPAQRAKGIALHRDRIEFTAALGGDTVVIHPPDETDLLAGLERMIAAIRELEPLLRQRGVTLSIENIWPAERNRVVIARLLDTFPPEVLGYTFDSGHANIAGDTDWLIAEAFSRLCCLHLHDNDGQGDQHRIPGMGTVDWDKIAGAIQDAGYTKPINFELSMTRSGFDDEDAFLARAHEEGRRRFG